MLPLPRHAAAMLHPAQAGRSCRHRCCMLKWLAAAVQSNPATANHLHLHLLARLLPPCCGGGVKQAQSRCRATHTPAWLLYHLLLLLHQVMWRGVRAAVAAAQRRCLLMARALCPLLAASLAAAAAASAVRGCWRRLLLLCWGRQQQHRPLVSPSFCPHLSSLLHPSAFLPPSPVSACAAPPAAPHWSAGASFL